MKQNTILTLISATLLTVSCGTARNSTAVSNAVEPDSLAAVQVSGQTHGDSVFHDCKENVASDKPHTQDVPSRIMVMDHSADFPHTGGERTIYTFSHNGWKITKVETRNPNDPDLKSIPLTPTDRYIGEWYSLTVPEEGNSLVIKTEPYSGRRYRELYITMYAGNIGRKMTVLQYSPGQY